MVPAVYEALFEQVSDRLDALGLTDAEFTRLAMNRGYPAVLDHLRTDDDLVRRHRLDALRETLTLDYPSWILIAHVRQTAS